MDNIKKLLANEKAGKIIFFIGIIGIALIFLSTILPKSSSTSSNNKNDTKLSSSDEYTASLENKISDIVRKITGDKNVSVLVTLESTTEYVYANQVNQTTNTTQNTQSDSLYKSEKKDDIEQKYIIIDTADGGEQALLVTEIMPTVKGVVIVSAGAISDNTVEQITNAVTTALNIAKRRVCVVGTYS